MSRGDPEDQLSPRPYDMPDTVQVGYQVSREGAYKIIVRALRTHQYHVKAGCDRFGIKSKLCDACKARTKPAPTTPPHPVPVQTTIAEAESVAAQATTTQRAAALSANAALDQHVAARGQREVAEREEKVAFDQYQMALQRRIAAQTLETTTREQSQSASKILAAATTAEKVAVANVKRVRERVDAENATARKRERVDQVTKMEERERIRLATEHAAAREQEREHVAAEKMAATRERVEEARERERVATEKSEVQNESVGGIQSAPVEIKDLERPNVAGELCAATGALNAYVHTFKFNLSGTHPDLRVWVTRGTTSGPPEVVFPRMTTTFGVRSADGSETNTRAQKPRSKRGQPVDHPTRDGHGNAFTFVLVR